MVWQVQQRPKNIQVLTSCDHVILHGKGSFPGITKLRILRWGDGQVGPKSSQSPKSSRSPFKKEAQGSKSEKEMRLKKLRSEMWRCYSAGSEDRERGSEPRNAKLPLEAEKTKKRNFLQNLQKEHSLSDPFETSDFQSCKRWNLCFPQWPSLW